MQVKDSTIGQLCNIYRNYTLLLLVMYHKIVDVSITALILDSELLHPRNHPLYYFFTLLTTELVNIGENTYFIFKAKCFKLCESTVNV